jgi:hypothetical protein
VCKKSFGSNRRRDAHLLTDLHRRTEIKSSGLPISVEEQRRTYLQQAALPSEVTQQLLTKCELQISEFSGRNLQDSCGPLDFTGADNLLDSLAMSLLSEIEDISQPATPTQDEVIRFCQTVGSLESVIPASGFAGNGQCVLRNALTHTIPDSVCIPAVMATSDYESNGQCALTNALMHASVPDSVGSIVSERTTEGCVDNIANMSGQGASATTTSASEFSTETANTSERCSFAVQLPSFPEQIRKRTRTDRPADISVVDELKSLVQANATAHNAAIKQAMSDIRHDMVEQASVIMQFQQWGCTCQHWQGISYQEIDVSIRKWYV